MTLSSLDDNNDNNVDVNAFVLVADTADFPDSNTTTAATMNNNNYNNAKATTCFSGDPCRQRPPIPEFQCYETMEEDENLGRIIVFHCTVPSIPTTTTTTTTGQEPILPSPQSCSSNHHNNNELKFHCRDRSRGVLVVGNGGPTIPGGAAENPTRCSSGIRSDGYCQEKDDEIKVLQGQVDHNFFDKGYTLAASTGFQIWPGSRLMIEALCWPLSSSSSSGVADDCTPLRLLQERIFRRGLFPKDAPVRILEIGAGIGVVGIALAAMGAHVLQTDLHTLVEHAIRPNQLLNHQISVSSASSQKKNQQQEEGTSSNPVNCCCPVMVPPFLEPYADQAVSMMMNHNVTHKNREGWIAATRLDWTLPLQEQLSTRVLSRIDWVVGCDCLWLEHMEQHLLEKFDQIFQLSPTAKILISYQKRGSNVMFTTLDSTLAAIQARQGWHCECLAWRSITIIHNNTDDNHQNNKNAPEDCQNDLFLFCITKQSL